MAIAGGACNAYRCRLWNGILHMGNCQMVLSSICVEPDKAVELLKAGKEVMVRGYDVHVVRKMLGGDDENLP